MPKPGPTSPARPSGSSRFSVVPPPGPAPAGFLADWRARPPFATREIVTLERPFHTPLHLCDALAREADFSQHGREWQEKGEIRLARELLPSLEASFFKARMPSHVRVRSVGGCGRTARLEVTFGSPHRLALDVLLCIAISLMAAGAVASGSHGASVLLAFCMAVGLVPSLVLEFRSRRDFRQALRRAIGGGTEDRLTAVAS